MQTETCPEGNRPAIITGAPPPAPDELDASMAADPWTIRARLTENAYIARCRLAGCATNVSEWLAHVGLDSDEMERLDMMVAAKRESHASELGPRFIVREFGNKARVGWFDDRGELVTMSYAEFANAHIERVIQVGTDDKGKPIHQPLVKWWLHHPLTPRYDRAEFRPGVAEKDMPEGVLNLWRGWPLGLRPSWADPHLGIFDGPEMPPGYCDLFLDHMLHAMCGGDEQVCHYLLGWMADALWNPGPSETAVVLRGPEGSGKSLWAQHFMEFFGIHALTLEDEKHILGNFNKQLMNKSVIFAEEAFFAGNKGQAAKLKGLVTSPFLFVEPKGVDGFAAPKMFRLVMASNEEHVIRAGRDDRRYLVLTVDAGEHNQDKAHFARLVEQWKTGGRAAMFRWLTGAWWGRAVGDGAFREWDRPITAALAAQKDLSQHRPELVVHNMLREGEVPALHATDDERGLVFVATTPLADARRLDEKDWTALGNALRVLAGKSNKGNSGGRERLGEGNARRQYSGYWLPPLDECRRRWEAHLGRAVEWPDDVQTWGLEPRQPVPGDDLPF